MMDVVEIEKSGELSDWVRWTKDSCTDGESIAYLASEEGIETEEMLVLNAFLHGWNIHRDVGRQHHEVQSETSVKK